VDFEVAHLSVLMVWRLPYPEVPTLIANLCKVTRRDLVIFSQGLQSGYFKAPPGTDLPAIPVPLLQQIENINTWPKALVL